MPKTMPRTLPSEPPSGLLEIPRAHDVVPIEHAARLVSGDRHRDPLRHPRVDEVPDRGPPEVVPVCPRDAGPRARLRPGLPKIPDPLSHQPGPEMWKEPRHDPFLGPLEVPHALELFAQERPELGG